MYELPPLKKTIAIPIQQERINKGESHGLINMRFDPTQNSPPSLWKMRLNKRVADSPIKYEIAPSNTR